MIAEHVQSRPTIMRLPLLLGASLAALAVVAGAFGSHGLRGTVGARSLEVFQTATTYQMYHAIALVLVSVLSATRISRRLLTMSAGLFGVGILLFSGSLYVLVLTDVRWVGPITPMGGVCFIVAWVILAAAALKPAVSEGTGGTAPDKQR